MVSITPKAQRDALVGKRTSSRCPIHLISHGISFQSCRDLDIEIHTQVHGERSPLQDLFVLGTNALLKLPRCERRRSITLCLSRYNYTLCRVEVKKTHTRWSNTNAYGISMVSLSIFRHRFASLRNPQPGNHSGRYRTSRTFQMTAMS